MGPSAAWFYEGQLASTETGTETVVEIRPKSKVASVLSTTTETPPK